MITIINYGSGNVEAIANIYKRLNINYSIAESPTDLINIKKLILPGVGAFDETMQLLNESGLRTRLDELVLKKKIPILGICVGMQIMANGSEEGKLAGLGWIDGFVRLIDTSNFKHKPHVPHMGWNSISPKINHPLLARIDYQRGFYFLHTYYFSCNSNVDVLCTSQYGMEFTSATYYDNIYGTQFHPEKSHLNGIQLLENFANL